MQTAAADGEEAPARVSSRELVRRGATLLDDVQFGDKTFLVMRFGRIAAVLSPFEGTFDRVRPAWTRTVPDEPPEEEVPDVDLDELQWSVLGALAAAAPRPRRTSDLCPDAPLLARALTRMEMKGLIRKDFAGHRITPLGARVGAGRAGEM